MTATLDFAFLARSVQIEAGGLIHALGMGFTHVRGALPRALKFAVGLHLWVDAEDAGTNCMITAQAPDGFEIDFTSFLHPLPDELVLEGRRAISSSLDLTLPLTQEGIHTVEISLGPGSSPHRLAFMVEQHEGRS